MFRFFRNLHQCLSLLLVTGFAGLSAHAQLVNIESRRMQTDAVRFAMLADALFNYSDQNGDSYYSIGSNLATQFKSKELDHIFFLLGSMNLVRAEGTDFQNSWFLHARYNYKICQIHRMDQPWRFEAFVQYQKNELLVIDSRFLVGTGLRFKVLKDEKDRVSAYLGNSIMYEIENSQSFDQQNYNLRNSTYASITFSPGNAEEKKIHLVNTLYFQPLYRALSNHRILEQFLVELPVTELFSLKATFNYNLISVTPANARDYASSFLFGLSYAFPADL